jgi:hypothetical protein
MNLNLAVPERSESGRLDAVRRHVVMSVSVEELIFGWLTEDRRVLLRAGGRHHTATGKPYIVFQERESRDWVEVAEAPIDVQHFVERFPDVRPVIDDETAQPFDFEDQYDDALVCSVVSRADALRAITGYLIGGNATIFISQRSQNDRANFFEDDEEGLRSFEGKEILDFTFEHIESKTGQGWIAYFSVIEPGR